MSSPKVVCVSPHLDDAVLSLGACLHRLAGRGVDVVVATLFAGDPADERPASYWDSQRGDETAGEAACNRRTEDTDGCAAVGATPVWAEQADIAYPHRRDPDELAAFLAPHIEGADAVLVPGWPLAHADHGYAVSLVVERFPTAPLAMYAEQPYSTAPVVVAKGLLQRRIAAQTRHLVGGDVTWHRTHPAPADVEAKQRGCAAYAGEMAVLGWKQRLAGTVERFTSGEYLGVPDGWTLPPVLQPLLAAAT